MPKGDRLIKRCRSRLGARTAGRYLAPTNSLDHQSQVGRRRATATADERKTQREANEARRQAMKNLLYRKDS